MRVAIGGASVAMVLALMGCGSPEESAANEARNDESMRVAQYQVAAKDSMKALLKDPGSAKYEDVRAYPLSTGYVFCGRVNSKNSFGGYTGFQRFVSGPGVAATEDMVSDFDNLWAQACTGAGETIWW